MPIIAEQPDHAGAIEDILDLAFGANRVGKTVYRLRAEVSPVDDLCFVAVEGDTIEGTIRYWPVTIEGLTPALLLGPIAVAPHRQSAGTGAALIRYSLDRAKALGHRIVLLVGDAGYYERFGFARTRTLGLTLPGPVESSRFLGLDLVPGALDGLVGAVERWQEPYWMGRLAPLRRVPGTGLSHYRL